MRIQKLVNQLVPVCAVAGLLAWAPQTFAVSVNLLTNPGFELDDASGGDVPAPTGYFSFGGNTFATASVPARSGSQALKIFGPFFEGGGEAAGQTLSANPGEIWEASAWGRNDSSDPIGSTNFAIAQIVFLDAGNQVLSATDSATQINASTPLDTWVELGAQATAPAGTTQAQLLLLHVQLAPVTGGSVFFDDAAFGLADIVPGDTDGDGDVDDADLGTAFSNFTGPVGAAGGKTASEGDTDGDGDVDDADLANAFSGFTGPQGPVAVPEPASFALLGIGGLLAVRRRRA